MAEHFLARGFESFLFYSDLDNWSQEQRGEGFVKVLSEAGRECRWLRWHTAKENKGGRGEWSHRRAWLLTQLKAAPKPIATFAANGTLAVELQELCEQANIAVPADVAIVGIEDYLLSVSGAHRSISGVDTNLEEQGYQGPALLDRLMCGELAPPKPVRVAPAQVITRKSSDILAVRHPGLARALHFIAEHFADAISVEDVSKAAGMSPRGLHQAFGEHVKCTPGDRLRNVRLDYAKKILAESEDKIESVALQSGYPNINTFFIAFRKAERTTPAAFRTIARRGR